MINILYTSRQNLAKAQRSRWCRTTAGCGPSGRPSYISLCVYYRTATRAAPAAELTWVRTPLKTLINGRPLTLPSRPCTRPRFHLLVDGSKPSWPCASRGNDFS